MQESYSHITDDNPESRDLYGDETVRKERLDAITFEDFTKQLISINAKLRGINPALHGFDGENVVVGDDDAPDGLIIEHQPPEQPDKVVLLKELLETAQSLPSIQDAALLIAAGITQIHPFVDGNGRLSRFLYVKYAAGKDFFLENSDEVLKGRSSIDIGSYVPTKFLERIARERLGKTTNDPQVRAEAVRILYESFKNPTSFTMYPDDVPLRSFKPSAKEGLSVPDYLRLSSFNLVTSKLDKNYSWEIDPVDKSQRQHFDGFSKDTRFGRNVDPD